MKPEPIEVYKHEGHFKNGKWIPEQTLKIYFDEDGYLESPRTAFDNVSKMICFHRDFIIGDEHNININNFEHFDSIKNYLINEYDAYIIYPLKCIRTSYIDFYLEIGNTYDNFVGFIYITKNDLEREWGTTPESKDKAIEYMEHEIDIYNAYLS